ncbi:MAG: DMT family transporter [Ilumatobacteraceae bacterium]
MPDNHSESSRDTNLGLIGIGIAVMAWGASGAVIKAIDMDSLAIGFWRFLIYVVVLATWMQFRATPFSIRAIKASAAGGVSLGLDVVFFFSAVKLTNVVNATTISALQPVIVAIVAARYFGERIRGRDVVSAVIALAAVVVIVIESSGTPEWSPRGDLLAVGAVFAWSGYFVFSKRSKGVLSPQEYTAGTGLWTAVICLLGGFAFGQDMSLPDGRNWLPLLGLTLGAGILGHSIMNWSLVRIPLWLGSVLTLLIPVIGAVVAWIFLGEALSWIQIVAIVVVVGALASILVSQDEPEPVRAPQAPATA